MRYYFQNCESWLRFYLFSVFGSNRALRRGSIPLFFIKNGHNGQKLWHFKVFFPQQGIFPAFLKVWLIQANADQCKISRKSPEMIQIGYITHRKCYYVNFMEHPSNCISHSYSCAGIIFSRKKWCGTIFKIVSPD